MRYLPFHAAIASLVISVGSPATAEAKDFRPDCSPKLLHSANHHRHIVIKRHGKRAPGRDIVKWGRIGPNQRPHTVRDCQIIRRYRNQLVALHTPAPAYAHIEAVPPAQPPAGVKTRQVTANGGSSNPMVNPSCESGGNSQVVDSSGTYWGKYQFDYQTWVAHGGNPGAYGNAPEWVQDQIAANVTYDAWPNC